MECEPEIVTVTNIFLELKLTDISPSLTTDRYLLGVFAFFTQNLLRSPSDTPNTWKVSKASVQSVPRVRSSQFRPPEGSE